MKSTQLRKSIYNLAPLESGGVVARAGFTFQDHVAASFCLEMMTNYNLKEVWCETQDDITLICGVNQPEEVEFIQVKDIKFDHLWSVAELCKREKTARNPNGLGTSILEKSLAHDRCCEPCRFRMITSWQVNKDLKILTLPLKSPARRAPNDKITALCVEVKKYVPDFKSENGNDSSFWIKRVFWQVGYDKDVVKRKNIQNLIDFVSDRGEYLAPQQIEERIYPRLLQKVREAAEADWKVDPEAKKIGQDEFMDWLQRVLGEVELSASVSAGKDMQHKMEDASLPPDYIVAAQEERRRYRQEILTSQYLDVSDRELIVGEVYAELEHLRSKLDIGKLAEGIAFYEACLEKLKELQESLPTKLPPPLFFLDGCMHDIADRCGHRYRRNRT
jgi:hypothetical protein